MPFCVIGYDGTILTANQASDRILGHVGNSLSGLAFEALAHPDDRPGVIQALSRCADGARHTTSKARFRLEDGTYRHLVWDASPAPGERIFVVLYGNTTPATDEERFRGVFEHSKDGLLIIHPETGILLEANPEAGQMLSLAEGAIGQMALWEVEHFAAGLGREILETLRNAESFRREVTLQGAGKSRTVELLCHAHRHGESRLIQCSLRDTTARTAAEAALRESEERFRVLVDGVRDYALFMMDPAGVIVSWNPGAERILGYSESEALGRSGIMIFTLEDQVAGQAEREFRTAEKEGRAEDERWHVRKDGSRFFASGILTSLRNGDGSLRGFAKVMQDITERKNNEEALRETQKLESIGLLAGGVAHDFNNLLTGILGNASLALEELPRGNAGRPLLQNVIAASKRAGDLTRQLLAYAGKSRFALETLRISDSVSEIVGLIHASIPEAVALDLELDPGVPAIEADPTQIQQVAMNLVINAAEAIEGQGHIRIATGKRRLTEQEIRDTDGLRHLEPGNYVYLEVEDSGGGMEDETRYKIFDPFFTTKFTGRGLGLAAVSGIVRGHKGGILVATHPGRGSRFRVYLPVADGKPGRSAPQEAEGREAGSGTILVADDEKLVREVAQSALERSGYRVLLARNGKEAVDVFQAHGSEITAVVLDLAMPVMGGDDALPHLRAIRQDVPVLITSGYGEMMMTQRMLDSEPFIQKPFTADQLTRSVAAAIRARREDGTRE